MPTLYIIHGYDAAPSHHWFPWLQDQLATLGVPCHILEMPNSGQPDLNAWLTKIEQSVAVHNEDVYFVGHSLGCITVLRHLERINQAIGGVVLVAGFAGAVPLLPQLDEFTAQPLNTTHLRQLIRQRSVIAADNDATIPFALTKALGQQLDAQFLIVKNGGHFLLGEGFDTLPVVLDELRRMFELANAETSGNKV
ncbi:serine hydrolase family protein [Iodobacter sp. HSC-16F04]|uniref:Serine hydrolase family protein n=1 Tax=Iodobacter violaceini TaxID=3044271 RepID=A0ABX0KTU7_9NEIS|nr:alpha/beta fold hydrolase [Iodobacter violacea]NHQ85469.1 serine hydrolase family protein [Iodobacter violacea]